ncbi:MAG: glycosyltransferase [Bacteroides sp.]|nr:glycosyltransferase [Bacteroides sp.]
MKICLFITTLDKTSGGPSRSVPLLAKGLSEIGVDTTLITCKSKEMNTHILSNSKVKLETIPNNISHKMLEEKIMQEGYDLIHCQNLWHPLYHKVAAIARKNNIPYMMTPRGCLEPWCLKQKRLKKKLALMLYQKGDLQHATCILATSDMEAENIRNLNIKAPIAIIPNGIDINEYTCRKPFSKPDVKQQVCFISRIHEKKGLEVLITAWGDISAKYPDWNLVIAGNGEKTYISKLVKMIEEKGLSNSVRIIPPIFGKEKRNLYYQSAIFILPSYSENFGMVIAEAMSCGLPVITTTATPWQDLNKYNLGWCIDLGVENLRLTISNAINKGMDTLFQMGQKGSVYINTTVNYLAVAQRNKSVYDWILTQSQKPDFVQLY